MGAAVPKQYLQLAGKTIAEHTLARLSLVPQIAEIVVAVAEFDPYWESLTLNLNIKISSCLAGEERVYSVRNALRSLAGRAKPDDWVLVHDVARPCVRVDDIKKLIAAVEAHSAGGILAAPVTDTLKKADQNTQISTTIDRKNVWRAFTPQMFRYGMLLAAIEQSLTSKLVVTDESSAIEYAGGSPMLVEGASDNIKITTPEDLVLAEYFLRLQNSSR